MAVSLKLSRLLGLNKHSGIIQRLIGSTSFSSTREYSQRNKLYYNTSDLFQTHFNIHRRLIIPRLFSISQSPQSSAAQNEKEQKETLPSEKEDIEYDKLYRSITVECRGHDKAVLASYQKFVTTSAGHLDITIDKVETPKHHIKRYDTLKSAFVHKKHRVQYEIRTHFLIMRFLRLTSSTADTFLEYIQRNLPEGMAMIVRKEELQHLPQYVKGSDKVAPQAD